MNKIDWEKVQGIVDDHAYMSGIDRDDERKSQNGEVFTPSYLVVKMLKSIPIANFAENNATLEPACGDGQFVSALLAIKIMLGMSANKAMRDIVGIDIMRDNVDLCRERCIKVAKKLGS